MAQDPISIVRVKDAPRSANGWYYAEIELSRQLDGIERNILTNLWHDLPDAPAGHSPTALHTSSLDDNVTIEVRSLEELRDRDAKTLKRCIDEVNRRAPGEWQARRDADARAAAEAQARETRDAQTISEITFD